MLATNRFYVGYLWRRERDSNDLLSNETSNLLTPLDAQGTHSGETAIRPHVGHTEAR